MSKVRGDLGRREILRLALAATAGSWAVRAEPLSQGGQLSPFERPGSGITDVSGIRVGQVTHARRPTGCTVVLCEEGAVAGVDVRGAAPGTRETDLLSPLNFVQQVHAILLAGGSAFGLEAATGVTRYLEERRVGLDTGVAKVPIVPAAVLFDLAVGDPSIRPDATTGYEACRQASGKLPAMGSVGAGAGATVGKLFGMERAMRGGIGTASVILPGGLTVGAIVAVNAVGDVVDPASGRIVAGTRTADGRGIVGAMAAIRNGEKLTALLGGTATTIGVVATDAVLDKAQATRIATMAHDGLARTINPVHTLYDGDTLFTLATGRSTVRPNPTLLGAFAAEVVAQAVLRAVRAATALPGLPAAADFTGKTR